MKPKFTQTFEELIKDRHAASNGSAGPSESIEDLFGRYYGKSASDAAARTRSSSVVVSLSFNDGEVLAQSGQRERFDEYVVQQSASDDPFQEYVVSSAGSSLTNPGTALAASVPDEEVGPCQEYQVDVRQPMRQPDPATPRVAAAADIAGWDRDEAPGLPEIAPLQAPPFQAPTYQTPTLPAITAADDTSRATATDDDFIADIQSILSGQKQFDPTTKSVTNTNRDGQGRQASTSNPFDNPSRPDDSKNGQAIFDRIAQSMEFANAYDLGTVELTNRFGEFDRIADLQEKSEQKSRTAPASRPAAQPSRVDTEDFIEDLKAIQNSGRRPVDASYGQDLAAAPPDSSGADALSQARRDVVFKYWPQVNGAKYKGNEAEKAKWQLLLPGVDIEKMRKSDPGYTTCGVLVPYLLKKLGGIEDPGILSGGLGGVRDGVDTKQQTPDPEYAKKIAGPYAWIDEKHHVIKGGAKRLGEGVWVPNDGTNRPKPGDIYLLEGNISKAGTPPMNGLRHIGVIIQAPKGDGTHPEIWETADAGQGREADQQALQQQRTYDPLDRTVTGSADKGTVVGWVDLDKLVQRSAEKIAEIKASAGHAADPYS